MRLDVIETFVTIVDAGSMREAARRLGVSKSVVSHRLAALEESLGTSLIQRTTRAQALTDAGTLSVTALELVPTEHVLDLAEHCALPFERHRDVGSDARLLDGSEERTVLVLQESVAHNNRLAGQHDLPADPFSGLETELGESLPHRPAVRAHGEGIGFALPERQQALVRAQQFTGALDDQP